LPDNVHRTEAKLRQRILVVEDDTVQSEMLAGFLTYHGFDVAIAQDGLQAIEKLRAEFYHAALIDYRIPEVDGLAVARVIVSMLAPGLRPILIGLTASPHILLEREAEGTAVFDAIEQKPLSLPSLLAAIQRCRERAAGRKGVASGEADAPAIEPGRRDTPEESASASVNRETAARTDDKRPRVLVVDDDLQLTEILKSALQFNGFDTTVANGGLDALRLVEANAYDAVVIDYKMPGMTGLAAAQSILRAIRSANPSRLVAFTATPESLTEPGKDTAALFDAVVGKSEGIPALLAAIKQSVDYKEWRSVLYERS